jgi:hypothetical protein
MPHGENSYPRNARHYRLELDTLSIDTSGGQRKSKPTFELAHLKSANFAVGQKKLDDYLTRANYLMQP